MRVVVTGGGTGGHLYPALAVADSLRDKYPDTQILYIGGDGIESEVVPKYGYDFREVPARWFSPYTSALALAETCVFAKQSPGPFHCGQLALAPLLANLRGHFAEF